MGQLIETFQEITYPSDRDQQPETTFHVESIPKLQTDEVTQALLFIALRRILVVPENNGKQIALSERDAEEALQYYRRIVAYVTQVENDKYRGGTEKKAYRAALFLLTQAAQDLVIFIRALDEEEATIVTERLDNREELFGAAPKIGEMLEAVVAMRDLKNAELASLDDDELADDPSALDSLEHEINRAATFSVIEIADVVYNLLQMELDLDRDLVAEVCQAFPEAARDQVRTVLVILSAVASRKFTYRYELSQRKSIDKAHQGDEYDKDIAEASFILEMVAKSDSTEHERFFKMGVFLRKNKEIIPELLKQIALVCVKIVYEQYAQLFASASFQDENFDVITHVNYLIKVEFKQVFAALEITEEEAQDFLNATDVAIELQTSA